MSSSFSSDQSMKVEIMEALGTNVGKLKLRIFPPQSTQDQKLFENDGLTFSHAGVSYGSCDAVWFIDEGGKKKPVVALEVTDALNRGSSGSAQYQRFHHALGAVRNGLVGIYYLKKGNLKIQLDLFRMAYMASVTEKGFYIITQDLAVINSILQSIDVYGLYGDKTKQLLEQLVKRQNEYWETVKFSQYGSNLETLAEERSTIIFDDYIVKLNGGKVRSFTDGSQRAGHIIVGEMYLSKYLFYGKRLKYLFPRMTRADIVDLDKRKSKDKEWYILRNEPNVEIMTMDDVAGLSDEVKQKLIGIKEMPMTNGSPAARVYKECKEIITAGLRNGIYKLTI